MAHLKSNLRLHSFLTFCILLCIGKMFLRYSNRNGHESVSVLVSRSVATEEAVQRNNTCADNNGSVPACYEVPVSVTDSQYETVTENPNTMLPLYEVVVSHYPTGGSSATSSLFYQYVPSKVRKILHGLYLEL